MSTYDQRGFRIEVWTEDGGSLVEIAARASRGPIITAAWNAAILTFPGKTLIEFNGYHRVRTVDVPEEPKGAGNQPTSIRNATLSVLPAWYQLVGICSRCHRHGRVAHTEIERRVGKLNYIGDLAPKLRCKGCSSKGGNRFGVVKIPR